MGISESIEWRHLSAFAKKAFGGRSGMVRNFLRLRPLCAPSFRKIVPGYSKWFKATQGGDRRDFIQACLRPTVAVSG